MEQTQFEVRTGAPEAPDLLPREEEPQQPEDRTGGMKSAFNRTALGLGALYEIYQMIGSALLALAAVVAAIVAIVPRIDSIHLDRFDVSAVLSLLNEAGVMYWILLAYAVGMVLGMVVGLIVMKLIRGKCEPIEKRSLSASEFLLIALMTFGVWGLGAVLGNLPAFFGVNESLGLDQLLEGSTWESWPVYLYTCIGAPLFEELACRKLLLDRLHPYGKGYAIAVSGLLFALIHGNSAQFFLALATGLILAAVYCRTGRVLYTILLHAMINTTASLPELLSLGNIDIDLGWNIVVGCLVVAGLVVLFLKRKDVKHVFAPSDVPGAHRAVWRNPGMLIFRIVGIATIVFTDALMLFSSLQVNGTPLCLVRLLLTALAILTVLLAPRLTRSLAPAPVEATPAEPEPNPTGD
ncbi:MAG: CPBP family intramembrane metalloprotease [Clostridia bacterium]|nr:CPBP family intramembrane metalloprotease [Clostridia bacterium]